MSDQPTDGRIEFTTTKAGIPDHFWKPMLTRFPELALLAIHPSTPRLGEHCLLAHDLVSWTIRLPTLLTDEAVDSEELLAHQSEDHKEKTASATHIYLVGPSDKGDYRPPSLSFNDNFDPTKGGLYYEVEANRLLRHALASTDFADVQLECFTHVLEVYASITKYGMYVEAEVTIYQIPPDALQRWREITLRRADELFGI